jgi:endonuclease YncB( thermonuclease family)
MAHPYTFRGNVLPEPPVGSWYNLSSGHNLKTQAKAKEGFVFLENPRIAGPSELISEFQTENGMGQLQIAAAPVVAAGRQYTFAGKTFTEPQPGSWYNLQSGLVVKNPKPNFLTLDNPRVTGNPETVESFRRENRLPKEEILGSPTTISTIMRGQNEPMMPIAPGVGLTRPEAQALVPALFTLPAASGFGMMPMMPFLPAAFRQRITPQLQAIEETYPQFEVQVCRPRDVGTVLALQTDDIEKVPVEHLESLCEFTLARIRTKARVMRVLDGDTFDLTFIVNMTTLTEPREIRTRAGLEKTQPVLAFPESQGFAMRMNCRLYGADAYEHNTPQGDLATHLMTNWLNEHKNVVYVVFRDFDKYGRPLVELYTNPDYTESYAQRLLDYTDPVLGKVAEPYFGGTKSEKAKALVEAARR